MKTFIRNRLRSLLVKTFSLLILLAGGACTESRNLTRVTRLIGEIRTGFTPDHRTALFEAKVRSQAGTLVLSGETTEPLAKQALLDSLNKASIRYHDSLKLLPDGTLGDTLWGLATLSVVPVRANPAHASEMVTQALMGTPMRILQVSDNWYRIQTPDRYIGWMEENGLVCMTSQKMDQWKKVERVIYNRINGVASDAPSAEANVMTDLVLGDILQSEGEQNGFIRIRLPDGRIGYVSREECLSWGEWTERQPDIAAMLSITKKLMGLPYLWGGTSTKGADCSGLTKTVWFSQGVILARDASQQARYGEPVGINDRKNLQPGDLLFFGRGIDRVNHVALYLGEDLYIHASGMVKISSLNPEAANYLPGTLERWVSARRILHALDREGITRVANHPWYN